MRAVVSRVNKAQVAVDGSVVGAIERGLLVYVGVITGDSDADATWLADKLIGLRVCADAEGRINASAADIHGGLLLIPNFTLAGRTRKGNRPSFTDAAAPDEARRLFEMVARRCAAKITTATGVFGAHMLIDAQADGPVTVLLDSRGE
jgi:D-tyrosyl-tRNA(Tyr) deacylase